MKTRYSTLIREEQYLIVADIQQDVLRNFNIDINYKEIANVIDSQYIIGAKLKKKRLPYRLKYIGTFGIRLTVVKRMELLKELKLEGIKVNREEFVKRYKVKLNEIPKGEVYLNDNIVKDINFKVIV